MTVSLCDANAFWDAWKSTNHSQKPNLSPRSIFCNKRSNKEDFFLIILAFYRLQRPLTRRVPPWANLQVIAKSMSSSDVPFETDALSFIFVSVLTSLCTLKTHTHSFRRCIDTREWFLIPSHILIRVNRNEGRPGSDRSLELIPHWRIIKSSFRNLFRNRLRWCPILPVKRRKTTRVIHTIPNRRILHHFWDTQNVTVSALSWSMPFML
jgi:hypothetical protein